MQQIACNKLHAINCTCNHGLRWSFVRTCCLLVFTWRCGCWIAVWTRMLTINVSVPNLTVARLQQFRSPQLRIQRERPRRPLDPRSRLCLNWIAWPRKPTPRIKQRFASCHTAEVISIQSLPAPPHTPRGQLISEVGGGPPPCLVWTSSPSNRLTLLF